jgi:hypothetical protein
MSAFADYIVPVALRLLGITRYSAQLEAAINSYQMIPHDSPWEVEIRAHCIYASALLAEEINRLRPPNLQILIPQIDARLWTHYHTTWWQTAESSSENRCTLRQSSGTMAHLDFVEIGFTNANKNNFKRRARASASVCAQSNEERLRSVFSLSGGRSDSDFEGADFRRLQCREFFLRNDELRGTHRNFFRDREAWPRPRSSRRSRHQRSWRSLLALWSLPAGDL